MWLRLLGGVLVGAGLSGLVACGSGKDWVCECNCADNGSTYTDKVVIFNQPKKQAEKLCTRLENDFTVIYQNGGESAYGDSACTCSIRPL